MGFRDKAMVPHYYFDLELNKWPFLVMLVGSEFFHLGMRAFM